MANLPGRGEDMGMILRYAARHISRAVGRSLLGLLLAAALIASLMQFVSVVRSNRVLVEEMYDNAEVWSTVVNRNGSVSINIPYQAVELLLDADFSSEYYAEGSGVCYWADLPSEEPGTLYNVTDIDRFGKGEEVAYTEGYGESIFLESDERLCVVSEQMLKKMGLALGDEVHLSGANDSERARYEAPVSEGLTFKIIGSFYGSLGANDVIVPFWTMKANRLPYYLSERNAGAITVATFKVCNDLLREESAYRGAPNDALSESSNSSVSSLMLRILDDEVKNVIKPLEENTNLLEMLLPVICVIVIVIGAATPGLIILQSSKEAAIMRVLGTPKGKVRTALITEQMVLCVFGLILGMVVLMVVRGFENSVASYMKETTLYAAGYAGLALIVCLGCATGVSARKPLELLQAKE